jgi:hypothetical protein
MGKRKWSQNEIYFAYDEGRLTEEEAVVLLEEIYAEENGEAPPYPVEDEE